MGPGQFDLVMITAGELLYEHRAKGGQQAAGGEREMCDQGCWGQADGHQARGPGRRDADTESRDPGSILWQM